MSSDLQSTLEGLRLNDYVSLIIITAVLYDYLLTFSREIDYVWRRPWTWVSTMFLLVRYVGLCWAITDSLGGTTFVPGPQTMCTVLCLITGWAFPIFLNAADLVLILRVYALWNRSKRILYILLFVYIPQVIFCLAFPAIYYNAKTYLSVTIVQVADLSVCSVSWSSIPSMLNMYAAIPRFILGVALLALAIIQTATQSVRMYKAVKQWQPNRYMQQLVRDGALYVLMNALFIISPNVPFSNALTSKLNICIKLFCDIALCVMMPRFIISVRELFHHDACRRWQGIDNGFGVLSQSITSQNTAASGISFADVTSGKRQIVERRVDEFAAIRPERFGGYTCTV